MQMNALRSAYFAKLSSSSATSEEYWLVSISAGTPGGYCLSQMRSMCLPSHSPRRAAFGGRDGFVEGSIEPAAARGKRPGTIRGIAINAAGDESPDEPASSG